MGIIQKLRKFIQNSYRCTKDGSMETVYITTSPNRETIYKLPLYINVSSAAFYRSRMSTVSLLFPRSPPPLPPLPVLLSLFSRLFLYPLLLFLRLSPFRYLNHVRYRLLKKILLGRRSKKPGADGAHRSDVEEYRIE